MYQKGSRSNTVPLIKTYITLNLLNSYQINFVKGDLNNCREVTAMAT